MSGLMGLVVSMTILPAATGASAAATSLPAAAYGTAMMTISAPRAAAWMDSAPRPVWTTVWPARRDGCGECGSDVA